MFIKPIPSIIRKVLYLFLFVSVLNCDQETNEEIYNSVVPSDESLLVQSDYIIKEKSLNELTDIKERIYSSIFPDVFKSDERTEVPFISSQKVLEVDNLKGMKNYSIKLNFENQEAYVIYNIVIGKNYEDKIIQESVIKYICSENTRDEFINSDYNFQYFEGTVKVYDYDRFFKDSEFEYKLPTECPDQYDVNGDPIPCTESTVSAGGSSTGGNGDTGSYSGDDGGETSGPISEGPSGAQEYIIVCQTIDCRNPILEPVDYDRKMYLSDCDDCSGPTSGVGVNSEDDDTVYIDPPFEEEQCLYDVFEAMGGSSKFNEYLKNFDQDFSVADLILTVDPNFSARDDKVHNAMAITEPPLKFNRIKIVFNTDPSLDSDITKQPDVFKAVSMIHEMIHAEMFRKMIDALKHAELNQSTVNWTNLSSDQFYETYLNALKDNYEGIWLYFTHYNYGIPEGDNPNDWQHHQIADNYRGIIIDALKSFDSSLSEDELEALSWIGLNEANIEAWKEVPNQDEINQRIDNIGNSKSNGCD